MHKLMLEAHQMHLNAALTRVIEGIVTKLVQLEVCIQFLIDAFKQMQIEVCRYTLRIIISAVQDVEVFLQIHADQQPSSFTGPGDLLQKAYGRLTIKVTDG